jgi:hypothetical protein
MHNHAIIQGRVTLRGVLALIFVDRIMVPFHARNFFSEVVDWTKKQECLR